MLPLGAGPVGDRSALQSGRPQRFALLGFRNDPVFTEEFTCDAGMDIVDDRGPLLGVACVYRLIQLIRCCAGESAGFEREACDDEVISVSLPNLSTDRVWRKASLGCG
jgi:hypothetical protein